VIKETFCCFVSLPTFVYILHCSFETDILKHGGDQESQFFGTSNKKCGNLSVSARAITDKS
jgi:hypothetical protein